MQKWAVVYDVDDVLWPLNGTVTAKLGIPIDKIVDFHPDDNPLLTPEECQALIQAYGDPEIFRQMRLYRGVEEIMRIANLGLAVEIRSNSYCREISDIKRNLLLETIPGIREDQLYLPVVSHGSGSLAKPMPENLLILVDDSPYNIAKSRALGYVLPRWPYNSTPKAKSLMGNATLCYVEPGNIPELVSTVEQLARKLLPKLDVKT